MGKRESLVLELRQRLSDLAPLLIEAAALGACDVILETINGLGSSRAARKGVVSPRETATKTKAKRSYTRVEDGAILGLLRETGPMRITQIHTAVGGSLSNLSKRVALLKKAGSIKEVLIDGERFIKLARDGRSRQTALPSAKKAVQKAVKKAAQSRVAPSAESEIVAKSK